MSIDLPDDDDDPWADEELPDDDDIPKDGLLPPELQEEFDRLLAAHKAAQSQQQSTARDRLTPDLKELETRIAFRASQRELLGDAVPPYMFERFEALATVRGGMGLVIKARDPQLERHVAIKLWMRSGPQSAQALLAEAKTLAKLKHPNVVMVHETGVWQDRVYFVMEWIEGVDGQVWMEEPRSWQEVRRVFIAAGTGLAAAHAAGIHHRDFKPSNVLIGDDGRVVVADFGVADSLHSSPERDEPGGVAGTPSYMAPERLRRKRGDARSDQFSFCAAMWRALYGTRPFAGDTIEELLESIEAGEVRELAGSSVPRWLSGVVSQGLAPVPDDRHQDMRALVAALSREPPDGTVNENDDDGGQALVAGGRVLHNSGQALAQRERWPYVAIGFLSAMVAVLGVTMMLMRSSTAEPPVAGAVEVDPYHAILGLVAADEFAAAKRIWHEHRLELTDAQSLQIARACLNRAKQLVSINQAQADMAALISLDVAEAMKQAGTTASARESGGELASEAKAQIKLSRPNGITN